MKAYNIIFGVTRQQEVTRFPNNKVDAEMTITAPDRGIDGWAGRCGPSVPWEQWPRNVETKTPMFHCITLLLPEEYRVKDPKFAAISFFQGGGGDGNPTPQYVEGSELVADFNTYTPHPQYVELTDIIDGKFGYIWLTEDEFFEGPAYPKPDMRTEQEVEETENAGAITAWETYDDPQNCIAAWLIEREDHNAGKTPVDGFDATNENNVDGYIPVEKESEEFWDKLSGYSHLGGTSFAVQGIPNFTPPLTPFYLELANFPGMNLGDAGNLQLDLKTGQFDWSCW